MQYFLAKFSRWKAFVKSAAKLSEEEGNFSFMKITNDVFENVCFYRNIFLELTRIVENYKGKKDSSKVFKTSHHKSFVVRDYLSF